MAKFRKRNAVIALAVILASTLACGKKKTHIAALPPAPKPSKQTKSTIAAIPLGYTEEGIASWYGVPYHGRPAADGEIYDMEKLVAAHRVLPFNTWLKVTNLANGKSVTVRIIDRGPFVAGRILDLSKAAARQIDLIGPGTGRVRMEVIAAPADIAADDFYGVQIGAFSQRANAERLRDQYAQRYGTAQLLLKQGAQPLWRVVVGKEPSVAAAQQLASTIKGAGAAPFVVRLDANVPLPAENPPVAQLPRQAPLPADAQP